jgi:hypothetical protein
MIFFILVSFSPGCAGLVSVRFRLRLTAVLFVIQSSGAEEEQACEI